MPVTKGAKRALRRDRRRAAINLKTREAYKEAVRLARREPSEENLKKAYSQLDRAAKKKVIHKNKAARLKSRLAKLLFKEEPKGLPKSAKSPKALKKITKRKNLKVGKAPLRPV